MQLGLRRTSGVPIFANGAITAAMGQTLNGEKQQNEIADAQKEYASAVGNHKETEWRLAFDENGNQITRRVTYSEEWVDAPVPQAIELVRKRAVPIDLEVKLQTTGEEVLFIEHERTVRSISRFNLDNPYDITNEPIKIGPWQKTNNTQWIKTGQLLRVRPVNLRGCAIDCGITP